MTSSKGLATAAIVLLGLAVAPYAGLPVHFQSLAYLFYFWITLATSWNILSGYSGYFSFGHGAFFGAGMYAMANLATKLNWPFLPSALVAGVLAAFLALAVGAVVFRLKTIRGESFALITLATTFVLATIIVNTPIDGGPGVYLMGVDIPKLGPVAASTFYFLGLIVAAATVFVAWWLLRSSFGLALLAIHDDEDVAEVHGVSTFWLKMAAFALSSFIAGVMGSIQALYVSYVTVSETFNITVPLTVVLMSILGGSRHWAGPMLGAILITLLTSLSTDSEVALVAKALTGIVLTTAVLLMPSGILGAWLARRRRRQMAGHCAAKEPREVPAQTNEQVEASDLAVPREQATTASTRLQSRSEAEVVLRARGLSKHFSGIKALQGVDLRLYRGEILGLLGPNGSGKSTFINVVSGHYRPTAGSFTVMGQECAGLAAHEIRRRGVSRTYQIPRPFSGLTVLQNVNLAALYGAGRLRGADAQRQARECLDFTDLADRADFFPDELNLHQRKFLELARALAARPSVILLDEVLSGLTPGEIASAVQTIKRIRDQGTSIVFVEHVMNAVMALSDRLVVLDQGQVIAEGAPREVMAREPVIRAYLGEDSRVS
ncbi:MAG: ABC transporter permease subunit [Betaproteobacteria bacterium]